MQETVDPNSILLRLCCAFVTGAAIGGIVVAVVMTARSRALQVPAAPPSWPRLSYELRPARPGNAWKGRPEPGEIWWARVPARGGKRVDRPWLVIRTHRNIVEALAITERAEGPDGDHLAIATASWNRKAVHDTVVDLGEPAIVTDHALRRMAARCDDETWAAVAARHDVGWAVPPE
ncbi:type II toxin-antitoxin system PemK/MazF family toxin [Phytomonospora sp. NPDC050363]|uniref:type II toxin-antitoxin system PemK/MazF family toxin n=1 Tax=Phytomonospora sp. NPDC050363 TaxID=3155642 RepID=UPI0033DEFF7C